MARLVVLEAAPGPDFVERLARAWAAGDAVLPLDPRLPSPARRAVLHAARPDEPVDDGDALVVATSGTTGAPRAVVLTAAAVRASALASSRRLGVDPDRDRWLAILPLGHVGGIAVVVRAVLTGTPLTFDPAEAATLVSLVPTQLRRLDTGRFRKVLVGGAAPPGGLPSNVVTTYGMTETGSGIAYDGVPLDGVEVRIGGRGEVQVRGPMLLRCYRDGTDPKDTGGWLPTGDAGALADGRLHIHGRLSDVIVTGGEKVWPAVVEETLRAHPAVADAAVLGRPDAEWGERVVAYVVPSRRSDPPVLDVLRAWVKDRLPAYAAPRQLVVVDHLPRTPAGKLPAAALPPA